jgi:protein arginine kinase activator
MKCNNCNKPATVHLTELKGGKKIEKHLCASCAAESEGFPVVKPPINEMLTNFVLAHSGMQKDVSPACEQCQITWADFRQSGLLGCAHDYQVFERDLSPLLQRAHEGATHHVGKVPVRASAGTPADPPKPSRKKTVDIARLRKDLAVAVAKEDYEMAARLRDQIKEAEGG